MIEKRLLFNANCPRRTALTLGTTVFVVRYLCPAKKTFAYDVTQSFFGPMITMGKPK